MKKDSDVMIIRSPYSSPFKGGFIRTKESFTDIDFGFFNQQLRKGEYEHFEPFPDPPDAEEWTECEWQIWCEEEADFYLKNGVFVCMCNREEIT
jgi:hypothetical protein